MDIRIRSIENIQRENETTDIWSDWLLSRRSGNSVEHAQGLQSSVDKYAAKVIEGAKLSKGMALVDIGTGEGLIAFNAIECIGDSLRVILTDISDPMLTHAAQLAEQRKIKHQCTFLKCSAEDLHAIPSDSVDAVTTRSVLAYVDNKRAALQEFYRILKPGGRISIAEPVLRDEAINLLVMKQWIADHPDAENIKIMRLIYQWKSAQYPDNADAIMMSPLTNYSERDLFIMAKESKFTDIHLELHLDTASESTMPWESFIDLSPHPLAPTLREIFQTNFSLEDQLFFEQTMRPLLDKEFRDGTDRMAYLTAVKASL